MIMLKLEEMKNLETAVLQNDGQKSAQNSNAKAF